MSVVLPCYNVEGLIGEAIESALAQTYEPLEVIAVDDGSRDGTLDDIKRYADRIQYATGPNQGASAARNRGLAMANGEYVVFLDADDLLDPLKVEGQMACVLAVDPRPDLVAGAFKVIESDGQERFVNDFRKDPWFDLIRGMLGGTSANLWRVETVRNVGGWNVAQRSSQEPELEFRMLKRGATVVYSDEMHTTQRKRGEGSITGSRRNEKDNLIRYIELRGKIFAYLQESEQLTAARQMACLNVMLRSLMLLYSFDAGDATQLFNRLIPKWFPISVTAKISPYFKVLYPFFGFKGTMDALADIRNVRRAILGR